MLTSDFNALSNEIGLNEANASNKVVTMKDIASLNGAMHFKGAFENLSDVISASGGDVVIISSTSKEYVYNGNEESYSSAYWVELGDESLYATHNDVSAISVKVDELSNSLSNYYQKSETSSNVELSNAFNEISNEFGNYLPLSGGELSGDLKILSGNYI
jgi:hypothetical protein